jgi:DNA (cytosine-5)-methyltransferase 1
LHSDGITVDLVTGGFPCQDASQANIDGLGTDGSRTGLYVEAIRLAGELGAALLMENVQNLFNRGFGDVLGALAEIGYDAEWEVISARDAGADHERKRVWIMGYPRSPRWQRLVEEGGILGFVKASLAKHGGGTFGQWRSLVSDKPVLRGLDGVSIGLERSRIFAVGNALTPYIPEAIGREIMTRLYRPPASV